jgi:hypothetical protein
LPVIVLVFAMDAIFTRSLKKSTKDDYAVWNALLDGKINSDIVIYGSSRASVHLNPKVFEDSFKVQAYNLGVTGHNFYMENLRHKLLLEYNKKPKLIVLSLDYFTLDKRKDLFKSRQFLPYFSNDEITSAIKTYQGFDYFDYKLPLIRYAGQQYAIANAVTVALRPQANKPNWYKGFDGKKQKWNSNLQEAKRSRGTYVQPFDTGSIQLFDQFLAETKRDCIKVVFVYAPEYIEGQSFVANRNEIFALYDSFAKKYDIPFYDYSSDSLCYNKDYFYNSQHLNYIGANLFTRKFVSDIKPLVQQLGLLNTKEAAIYTKAH